LADLQIEAAILVTSPRL